MKVGFVCTNYNNSSLTANAVASLLASRRREDVRIVVVDNKSSDKDIAALQALARQFPEVELVLNPENVGYFPGLNIGIQHLRRTFPEIEHMVIGNNDLVFPETFVEAVQSHRDVFDRWAVVAPDLVTLDGVHQNPHVVHPISPIRKLIWDLHFLSYASALLILQSARITKNFTARPERMPRSELFKTPGPITMGYGACYLLGPVFFRHFSKLCAPTFMMEEEFFLSEQLLSIGQMPYYDTRFVITHHDHASMDQLPGRRHWQISRDAHRVYKYYLALSPGDQAAFIASGSRENGSVPRLARLGHAVARPYQICTNCVMDTSDSGIAFDSRGWCDYCRNFHDNILPNWHPDETGERIIAPVMDQIRRKGKGRDHDCLIGISGGVDSSYLAYIAKTKFGLRPLLYHVDAGWNSQESPNNIEKMVDGLCLDLHTEVIDWPEMQDLQLAFFKAQVPHVDTPQDHAIFGGLYNFAAKHGFKYVLTGGNYSTECVREPLEWHYHATDLAQLKDIHRQFGTRPLKTFPLTGIFTYKLYLGYVKRMRVIKLLDYTRYRKAEAMQELVDRFGWTTYEHKHYESRFTRFYEGYWLPTKFGYDKRRAHFSSLILTKQMSRAEALTKLAQPAYDVDTICHDFEYVATKLDLSVAELRDIMNGPNKSYRDYRNSMDLINAGTQVLRALGLQRGIIR